MTKGVPIEATTILAREFPPRLRGALPESEIGEAQGCLFSPGIGVTRDARIAISAGRVSAMHDSTEGGVLAALWELAEASQKTLRVDPLSIPVPALAKRVCEAFGIGPLCSIASGALLVTAPAPDARAIWEALKKEAVACADIGMVVNGPTIVERITATGFKLWPPPLADGITKAFGA